MRIIHMISFHCKERCFVHHVMESNSLLFLLSKTTLFVLFFFLLCTHTLIVSPSVNLG